jgi:hypothetical protein
VLDAMLSSDGGVVDESAVRDALDAAGFGDVPTGLLGTAVGHYADSAPIGYADSLAPMATEASNVPFDSELDVPANDVDIHDVDPMDDLDADADAVLDTIDEAAGEDAAGPAPDDDDDASEFGVGSSDAPAPYTDEEAEPVSELDDGFASELDDPAAFDDIHDVYADSDVAAGVPGFDDADNNDQNAEPDDIDAAFGEVDIV